MILTPNFILDEFVRSQSATRLKIDNTPTQEHIDNLQKLCEQVLEPVRELVGKPLRITSGYRSAKLNSAVGGSRTSQHNSGLAADFVVDGENLLDIVKKIIESDIPFDQCLAEDWDGKTIKWIHISGGVTSPRRQILTMFRDKGKVKYFSGFPTGDT